MKSWKAIKLMVKHGSWCRPAKIYAYFDGSVRPISSEKPWVTWDDELGCFINEKYETANDVVTMWVNHRWEEKVHEAQLN